MKILENPIVAYALGLVTLYLVVYIIGAAWSSGRGGEKIVGALGSTVGLGGDEDADVVGYRASSLG